MTEFNSEEEMSEQLSLYFDTLEELSEKDQEYMSRKYRHVLEKLDEIDALLNETSNGWKTKRMSRVDLTALRLAVYELKYDKDVPSRACQAFWRRRFRFLCKRYPWQDCQQ